MKEELFELWCSLIKSFKNLYDVELRTNLFYDLYNEYSSESRHYHNLTHINNLLKYSKDFDLELKDRIILELAIWFHDVVYDPKSKTNEYDSVLYLNKFLLESFNFDINKFKFRNDVSNIVLSTKHNNSASSELEKIMCDIDLREFAEDWYMENSFKIKKEFSFLSDKEWREGRINFIKEFLNRKRIYQTDVYYNKYEKNALNNLNAELNYLNNL